MKNKSGPSSHKAALANGAASKKRQLAQQICSDAVAMIHSDSTTSVKVSRLDWDPLNNSALLALVDNTPKLKDKIDWITVATTWNASNSSTVTNKQLSNVYRSISKFEENKICSPATADAFQLEPDAEAAAVDISDRCVPSVYIPSSIEINAVKLRVPAHGAVFTNDENVLLNRVLAIPSCKSSANGTYNWTTIATQFSFKAKAELLANPIFDVYQRNAEALRQRKKTMDQIENKKSNK